MTHPGGGGDINLSALWVPVMPETSQMAPKMREAGTRARQEFEQGFSGGGGSGGGSAFADKFANEVRNRMGQVDFIGGAFDKFGEQVDAKLSSKLKGQLPGLLRDYRAAQEELTTAQQKGLTAEQEIDRAREAGITKASVMIPLMKQQTQAHKEIAAAQEQSDATGKKYNDTLDRYNVASEHTFNMSSMLAGVMGGALVLGLQGVIGGFEKVIELGVHLFEGAVEGAEKLADKLIEIGEDYHGLQVQLTEFSGATGEAFDTMNEHAATVFGQLDVAGKDFGTTYAQLSSILNLQAGPALDNLSRQVEELAGRYKGLQAEDVANVFHVFKIQTDDMAGSLATLLDIGQKSGEGLVKIIQPLAGGGGDVLKEANLSLGQSAQIVGDIEKHGIPATQVMTGLQTAMKLFGKENLDFKGGLQALLADLSDPSKSDADKQDLAQKAFGVRRWADVLALIPDLLRDIGAGASAFDAPAGKTDEFLRKSQQLDNKIQEFKHHIEGMLAPFGETFLGGLEHSLDRVKTWFDDHHDEVILKIKDWGDKFIDMLPEIKDWAETFVRLMGVAADGIKLIAAPILDVAAGFAAITGHWDDAKKLYDAADSLFKIDFGTKFDHLADQIHNINIDTNAIKSGWGDAADSALNFSNVVAPLAAMTGGPWTPGAAPTGPGVTTGPTPNAAPGGPVVTLPPPPSGASSAPPGGSTSIGPNNLLPLLGVTPSGTSGPTGVPSGNDQAYWAKAIFGNVKAAGYSDNTAFAAVADSLFESSGDPNNPNNPTHFGLFQESGDKPHNGPAQQISWFIGKLNELGGPQVVDADPTNIIADRVEAGGYPGSKYDLGAARKILGMQYGDLVGGGQGGVDDIPAYLTAGEFVMNKGATSKYLNTLRWMNAQGFDSGGAPGATDNSSTGSPQFGGIPGAPSGTGEDIVDWLKNAVSMFNSQAGTNLSVTADYPGGPAGHPADAGDHAVYRAIDIGAPGNDQKQMDAFAQWWVNQPELMAATRQLIHNDPTQLFKSSENVIGGHFTEGSQTYASSPWSGHVDHVHLALQYVPGASPSPGGSQPGSVPNASSGFMSGLGFGGGTSSSGAPSSGRTYDPYADDAEITRRNKAVRDANDRAGNVDAEITKKTKERDGLNTEIGNLQANKDPLQQKENQDKIKADQDKITTLSDELTRLGQDKLNAADELKIAQDDANKPLHAPSSSKTGTQKGPGSGAAEEFGKSFLSGIAQELGFPDVFGKAPWEFGISKLLTKGLGIAFDWGNQIGDRMYPDSGGSGQFSPSSGGLPSIGLPSLVPHPADRSHQTPGYSSPGPGNNVHIDQSSNVTVHPAGDSQIASDVAAYHQSWTHNQHKVNTPGTFPA